MAKKPTYRAGKRKCTRCTKVWNRQKGERSTICDRCKVHCSRCDVELTDDTRVKVSKNRGRAAYLCKNCANEICRLTQAGRKEKNRDYQLVRHYGITAVEYDAILELQQGACFICEKTPTGKRLAVDHRHVPKDKKQDPRETRTRVRGLLCWSCNGAIGSFKDSITLLRAAAAYLEELPAQQILNKEKT